MQGRKRLGSGPEALRRHKRNCGFSLGRNFQSASAEATSGPLEKTMGVICRATTRPRSPDMISIVSRPQAPLCHQVAQAVDGGLFFLALPESPLGSRLLKHALFFSVPIDPSPHAWLLKRAMRAYRLAVASRCLGVPRHALMPSRAHARSFFTEYTLN